MPGLDQIPAGAEGAAALSFTYSGISLICSALLLWLTFIHHEMWSYISLLCISTGLSTIASLTQQVHDTLFYEDVMREQFRRKAHFFDSPELAIANGSFGLDLGLYYFQYYSYNVQALLVMFWAGELAQSVYGLSNRPKTRRILGQVNTAGKAISFLFPAITILTLRAPSLQHNFFAFILLADLPLMISLAVGSFTMIMISWRYVKMKKSFTHWTPPGGSQQSKSQTSSSAGQAEFSSTQYGGSATTGGRKAPRKPGFHDRWLMVRFSVSFIILAVFEVTNILFQLQAIKNLENDSKLDSPDLSVGRANTTYFLFLPGVTAGIFLFIVFGTTKGCREKIRDAFVPAFVEKWLARRRQRGEKDAEAGRLEFTYPETTDVFPDDSGNHSPGKGRIIRSSSITVTYHNNTNNGPRRQPRVIMDPNEISSDSDDYRDGNNVAMSDLQPITTSHHTKTNTKAAARPQHTRSPSDQTLDSIPDSASTDEIITISHAAPITAATPHHIAHNPHRNNSISNTVTSTNTSNTLAPGRISIEQLMKPLPIPTDTPMSRIAYFQSMNRSPPPQAGSTRDQARQQVVTVNEMDRHFAEHERRQAQQRQHQRSLSQQQQHVQSPPRTHQTGGLRRQWSQGSINSSRVGLQQPPPRPSSAAQHRSRPGSTSQRGQMGELYYGSSPEHSDDSEPVLPVMGTARK